VLGDEASSNPFGSVLPIAGTKCALDFKSEDSCSIQQCALEDYSPSIGELYGTVGLTQKSIHNCLSTTGFQSGLLALSPTLPDGQNNTLEGRNKIYEALLGMPPVDEVEE